MSGEWGSNPRSPASKAGGLPLSYPLSGPRGICTLISGVRGRRPPVGPAAQGVIPDGLEPSLPGCGPGVFAAGPRDHVSSRGRSRTDNHSPGSRPGRFACLRTRPQLPDPGLAPDRGVYEALLSTCPSGESDQGESRTPTLAVERGLLRTVCLPVPPLGHSVCTRLAASFCERGACPHYSRRTQ